MKKKKKNAIAVPFVGLTKRIIKFQNERGEKIYDTWPFNTCNTFKQNFTKVQFW